MKRIDKMAISYLTSVFLIVALVGWMRVYMPEDTESLDWWWYDRYAEFEPSSEVLEKYVVILVDDESLALLEERWPMSRKSWAALFRKLGQGQARAVSVDAWFETPAALPGLTVVETMLDELDMLPPEELGEQARGVMRLIGEDANALDVNRQLTTAVLEAGNILMGMACLTRPGALGPRPIPPWLSPVQDIDLKASELAYPCPDLATSYNELGAVATGTMGVNARVDPDGYIRRYPLYFGYQGAVLPNMATAALTLLDGPRLVPVLAAAAGRNQGMPLIRPFDLERVKLLQFMNVLQAEDPAILQGLFKDKLVFVGVNALGAEDLVSIPGRHRIPGVYSHVVAAINAESGAFVDIRGPWLGYSVLGSLLALIVFTLAIRLRPMWLVLMASAVAAIAYLGLAIWALERGVLITAVPWLLGVLGVVVGQIVRKLIEGWQDRQQVKRVTGAFEHYVAPEVIEVLLNDPEKLRLGGERQEITAFFSDVAGFTSLSEKVEPTVLVELLNQVLGDMTVIIIEDGGIVDKYIGDAVVAMFGAPIPHEDHPRRAIQAALRSQVRMAEIKTEWVERGLPPIRVRIGINTGVAVVGNIGAANRFDFTMMGDIVNLAARLEGINNYYGSNVLVGEDTYARVRDDFVFREVDRVRVKGKKHPISMYEPIAEVGESIDEEMTATIASYKEGLEKYRGSDFEAAIAIFEPLATAGDGPSKTMLERAQGYLEAPPPEDWDGVYTMTSK